MTVGEPSPGHTHAQYNNAERVISFSAELTLAAAAIAYARNEMPVFPVRGKVPIIDKELGFTNGFHSATTDAKLAARAWWKHRDAGIGYAIPPHIQIFDLDVAKDAEGNRITREGRPVYLGLKSFQQLILDLDLPDEALDTLTVRTHSGGRHIFYRMPEGIASINRVGAMEGLDLKGYGGYVILPPSPGKYGKYEFLHTAPIRAIPDALLEWILQYRKESQGPTVEPAPQYVEDPRVEEFVNEIMEAWNAAIRQHMGNEMRLAIAGTLFHYGWPEEKAQKAMLLIIEKSEVRGLSDKNAVEYTYKRGSEGLPVSGFSTLQRLIRELTEGQQ